LCCAQNWQILVIVTSEIDLSVGSATALGVLVALLTLKGVGFSTDQPCAGQWHQERRSSTTSLIPN
jgi:ribose/xylose/arabinose/galactoside ABC-type transport system permease subunit